jgi:hypothetical protein
MSSYDEIGERLGIVGGILAFVVAYLYCIATGGFLLGLGLGWLPSAIFATIVYGVVRVGWGVIALLLVLLLIVILSHS